jgi:hypothetical protein
MPVGSKRARAPVASTEAKKAKVVDPITEKIEMISKTISENDCQLQESHREMLLLALPHTLTVTSEERHEYQSEVAQMIGKVLSDYVTHWEQQVADSKFNISASAEKAAESMKIVEESAAMIGEQADQVKECKGVVQEDSEAVKAAEKALQIASDEVAEFDGNLQVTITEKDHCSSVYQEGFAPLKSGSGDAKEVARLLKEVQPMLKKLSTESSLLSALAPAFKKPAAERGPFDFMAIEGAEKVFTEHLEKLHEQIDKADVTKADKVSTEKISQETLKAAEEKLAASTEALKTAEQKLASLEEKHVDLLTAMNAAAEESEAAEAVVATKEGRLTEVQSALGAFTELLERQATPEPFTGETTMVEDKLEAVHGLSPMEPVSVA